MTRLLTQAAQVLEVAEHAASGSDLAIIIERRGGIRVLDASGWTTAGLTAEYGGAMILKLQRADGAVSVEGRHDHERCLVERNTAAKWLSELPLSPSVRHPITFQTAPLSIAGAEE